MRKSILLGVNVLLLIRAGYSFSDDDNWPIIRAAAKASSENLRSGRGTGTYRHFTRKSPTDEWGLTTEAKVSTYFTDGKYHVDMQSDSEKKEYDRRIIIFDGNMLADSRFSARIRPLGAEGEIFSGTATGSSGVRPSLSGFVWDVTKLPAYLMDFDALIEAKHIDGIKLSKNQAGDILGEYSLSAKVRATFRCPKQFDFNIAEIKAWNEGTSSPAQENYATWKKSGDLWFVSSMSASLSYPEGNGRRVEFEYQDFVPNAAIDDSVFTIAALSLPAGARIIDHRPNVEPTQRILRVTESGEAK